VRTPFNLLPLITGRLPAGITSRLISHLTREFWPRYPIPTVAIDDACYNPNVMWRGPTWININYLFIDGLQRIGQAELARELRHRTLELICRHADIYEYYNPETGANPAGAASTFGWSAALFIDLALQAPA
jgi:glycogen debranching enzyme